ncbi:hypothetical protein AHEV_158 [Adoxophyes honmai entomopoxvirus 'L']|uniref:RING-type domain-containing protein n=1 Tax=Adoxophyes honmai entomopoxvirus 'L' TaxID=1293540 RepID=A0A916KP62_9POXV|nr:hypothetical protein AHEV_158 [Adoxophyes honmai entomopoxvirus 'L']CCU55479.1 hypothetical protein AHEV_158 [Adoxophyes honmai entomopoxvirus 'L']
MSPDLELMLFLMYMLGLTIAYGIYVESDIKYKNYIKYISIYFTPVVFLIATFIVSIACIIIICILCYEILKKYYNILKKLIITKKISFKKKKRLKIVFHVICISNYIYKCVKAKKELIIDCQVIGIIKYIYDCSNKKKYEECPICYIGYNYIIIITLKCNHQLCYNCLLKLKNNKCHMCRSKLKILYYQKPIDERYSNSYNYNDVEKILINYIFEFL